MGYDELGSAGARRWYRAPGPIWALFRGEAGGYRRCAVLPVRGLIERLVGGLVLGGCFLASSASAYHQTWGSFGPAFRSCAPDAADVTLPGGVPACSARPSSDCSTDPGEALRLSRRGAGSFRIRPLDARIAGYTAEEDARFRLRGVEDCGGQGWSGATDVMLVLRVTIDDPACAGGVCTLPDIALPHPLPCAGGSCEAHHRGTPLLAAIGLPPFPTNLSWSAENVSLFVRDPAGGRVLAPWLSLTRGREGDAAGMPSRAGRYEARRGRAFPACDPADVDDTTSAGLAACAGGAPLSDCGSDPASGVSVASRARRSKLKLYAVPDGVRFSAVLAGLLDCAGRPYDGPVALVATVRPLVVDSRCAGGRCTTPDAPMRATLAARGGRSVARGTLRLDLGAPVAGVELVRLDVRDRADRPILVAPGFNVTCGPQSCYGN